MKRDRKDAETRRAEIIGAALSVTADNGWHGLTARAVADRAGCSFTLVKHYFATMPQLRRAVVRAAITAERADVVAQALAARDKQAQKAPEALKQAAGRWIEGARDV